MMAYSISNNLTSRYTRLKLLILDFKEGQMDKVVDFYFQSFECERI